MIKSKVDLKKLWLKKILKHQKLEFPQWTLKAECEIILYTLVHRGVYSWLNVMTLNIDGLRLYRPQHAHAACCRV